MKRFLKTPAVSDTSPAKRAHVDQGSDWPTLAQQHAFLDLAKKKDWAAVKKALSLSPRLINVQPCGRWTVLHQASEAGSSDMVTFLIEQGADLTLKTTDGKTSHEVAKLDAIRALFTAAASAIVSAPSKHADISATSSSSASVPPAPVWQFEIEAGRWVDMDADCQALLDDAKVAGVSKAMVRAAGHSYIIDLESCKQTSVTTGVIVSIRRHAACLNASAKKDSAPTSPCPVAPPKVDHTPGSPSDVDKANTAPAFASLAPDAHTQSRSVASPQGAVKREGSELKCGETVEVPSSGAKPYTVKNCGGGVWSCTCVAWKMQGKKPTNERSCKHIAGVRGAATEQQRLGGGSSTAAQGSSTPAIITPPKRPVADIALSASKADGIKGPPPLLLANKWDEAVDPTGMWISEKLDGMRAFWDPVTCCFLSRLGNAIPCPKPFLAGLPNVQLDGELFLGRGRFQELMSVVKNGANVGQIHGPWKEVRYVVFDLPDHGGKFEDRMAALRAHLGAELPAGALPFARFHEQQLCTGRTQLEEELKRVQAQDGEGLMLRRAGSLYEPKRSNTLLKVKTFQDEEAVVLGHEPGKGRNSGVTGALRCRNRAGALFSVGTGLNDEQRAHPPKVGEIITYRFFELTKDNKPRFPSFVGIRADADRKGLEL